MYYNPKVYHASSVDTDIASGKRVNYRIPGGKRTGNHPWFLSPYNKQSSLSTNGRAVGDDYYSTLSHHTDSGVMVIDVPDADGVSRVPLVGDIVDITITSGPNAGDSFHRTVYNTDNTLTDLNFTVLTTASDANFGAVTKNDGSAWSWLGVSSVNQTDYNCKVTF